MQTWHCDWCAKPQTSPPADVRRVAYQGILKLCARCAGPVRAGQ